MDENYTDEFMDEDEDLYVEDENPDPEQEADMHKSIEPDSVDSVEVVRTAVIQRMCSHSRCRMYQNPESRRKVI